MTSKLQNKAKKFISDNKSNSPIKKLGDTENIKKNDLTENLLSKFQSAVDNKSFYNIANQIFSQVVDPLELVKCAESSSKREPGGAFYRAKFWAKTAQVLSFQEENNPDGLKFKTLCNQVGVNSKTAKGYVMQGQAIIEIEDSGTNTDNLRATSPAFFQYAQKQKDRIKDYLIEAIEFLTTNSTATHTQIHRNWCKKHGGIKANLDIIKPSDWWAFSHPKWRKDEDFLGSIPGEIYANALYYFAPKRGVAVDAMAGSGMLKRVYDDRERWQKDSDFNLKIHLFDLKPCRSFIKKHDARKPLPLKADWIFIDPPYYGQSSHLFSDPLASVKEYDEYLALMKEVITSLAKSLNPDGKLCVFLPKWSGFKAEDLNYNVPSDIAEIAIVCGLNWIETAYVSRGRQQEQGSANKNNMAKRDRRMRSDTCVLNVFEKKEN